MTSDCSIRVHDAGLVDELTAELGVHRVTARCLLARGVQAGPIAKAFLEPRLSGLRPPVGLAGLDDALPRLLEAAQSGERVGVFGDYDVDGVTTATLLTEALEAFGMQVITKVASRKAGYGFTDEAAQSFVDAGCTLIIIGDCGTSDISAIALARDQAVPAIIIDHHTVPSADSPHPALALINPFRTDSEFPFQGMASVGLAFYVMGALRTALKGAGHFSTKRPEPNVTSWLDLVAMGTVADLVPLSEENRIMTTEGLRHLNLRGRPGVDALLEVAGVPRSEPITERTIGWKLGPRLNAPGRLGDAQAALDVLRAPDRYTAQAAARLIETINNDRRACQDKVFAEAMKLLESDSPSGKSAIVIAGEGWAHGVMGIIASRLVDHYRMPAVVIAIDAESGEARGSARSFGGVNLYDALEASSENLLRFGGHAAAAGLSLLPEHVGSFRELFLEAVKTQGPETVVAYECDAEVGADELSEHLANELQTLAPFGKGNAEPLLMSRNVEVTDSRRVGDGSHLKLTLRDGQGRELSAIAFGLGEKDPGAGNRIDLAYMPAITRWAGRKRLELSVKGLWPSQGAR
ncbi:MAG: single-stranded-DNA-specific exonuclease RecJ [Myxococcales bacterium]|nr:single-stranded-DNA-specific exonuclease RecJ [Myxococcales bacterium]